MSFEIFVAVDICGGSVVRLTRGQIQAPTVYDPDPVMTALRWQQQGARWLHVVDLDRASGRPEHNGAVIERLLGQVEVPVEVGGGIRSVTEIDRWIDRGATRVCLGTKAADPEFLAQALQGREDRVVVSLDALGGDIQVDGWQRPGGLSLGDAAAQAVVVGAKVVMFTDIDKDGTLEGPNVEATRRLLDEVAGAAAAAGRPPVSVIASGGVSTAADIERLRALEGLGLAGVVVGRALYAGTVTLPEALAASGP